MRIVIDLQACQSPGSRFRGIGRYSGSLAQAMLRSGRGHEFWIALNGGLTEVVEDIRASFDGLLPQDRIVLWDNPFPAVEHQQADPWRNRVAEVLREDFLHSLRPDFVHVASLFEGWDDPIATSIGRGSASKPRTAVTLYDLIPLAMQELYLHDPATRRWYERKLVDLRRADLCLAISDFTREQGIGLLDLAPSAVVNISGSIDGLFRRLPDDPGLHESVAARYGIWRPFVMYTGGFDPRKNVAGLIRAYAALPPGLRERRQLVIVGAPPADVRSALQSVAVEHGLRGDELRFVGFVPDPDLVALYNACDLYVFPSRCEGFGLPALEAMACGAPVIGADATSLPEVMGYPEAMFDPDSDAAMSAKMLQGLEDPGFRRRLVEHAAERVQLFSWTHSAQVALDAMEAMHAATAPAPADQDRWTALSRQSRLLTDLVQGRELAENELRRLAAAQSENHPPPARERQLIVDISNLARHDAGTGIQRVVRNILRAMYDILPPGYRLEPVRFDEAGHAWLAREFVARSLGRATDGKDALLDARPGDVFLGLDLSAHIIPGHYERFDRLRRRGVSMNFVVYDLVPLLRPDCVNPVSLPAFHAWYDAIGTLADGLCCISRAVAGELADWCDQARPARRRPLRIGHFHLGADLDENAAENPGLLDEALLPGSRRTLLMVGTIEPRKGYVQALAAFEALWRSGHDLNLAIVGRQGWLMEEFVAGLRSHAEFGRRLHWFDGIDDERLRALYAASAALLCPSEGEGFGLPLVEAARHGLPVIARRLPVFTEVAGAHAFYFDGHTASALASAIAEWMELDARGAAPPSRDMPRLDWRQSAQALLDLVIGQQWDTEWMPGPRHWFPATDPRLKSQVGVLERGLLASTGHSGFLAYGPYVRLPAGAYRLRAFGAWLDASGPPAWLDVVTGQGRNRALHHEFPPDRQGGTGELADVGFILDGDAQDLEIRLWVSAETLLALRGFELVRVTAPA